MGSQCGSCNLRDEETERRRDEETKRRRDEETERRSALSVSSTPSLCLFVSPSLSARFFSPGPSPGPANECGKGLKIRRKRLVFGRHLDDWPITFLARTAGRAPR